MADADNTPNLDVAPGTCGLAILQAEALLVARGAAAVVDGTCSRAGRAVPRWSLRSTHRHLAGRRNPHRTARDRSAEPRGSGRRDRRLHRHGRNSSRRGTSTGNPRNRPGMAHGNDDCHGRGTPARHGCRWVRIVNEPPRPCKRWSSVADRQLTPGRRPSVDRRHRRPHQ